GNAELDTRKEWLAKLTPSGGSVSPGAAMVLTSTKQFRHPLSERRSRMLVSETTIAAPVVAQTTTFFVDASSGNEHVLAVTNGNAKAVEASFTFQVGSAKPTEVKRTIAAAGRLEIPLSQLFSGVSGEGVLRVNGGKGQPVAAGLLRQTKTSRNETLLMGIAPVASFDSSEGAVIAGLRGGGGYGTELVLMNNGTKKVEGDLSVLQAMENGELVRWSGATLPLAYAL